MIVFTNGCFDIIHAGHVDLLQRAKALGTRLVVGINSDESVRSIKGVGRPVQDQTARREVLLGLSAVDEVVIFDELTPEELIKKLKPDVLVKGGDWSEDQIIGADFVRALGGQVFSLPLKEGYSSSDIMERIRTNGKVVASTAQKGSSIEKSLDEHLAVLRDVITHNRESIRDCADVILQTFLSGNKVLLCGNGGSAADAQHM